MPGSGKGSNPRLLGISSHFPKIGFFDPSTPSMRKGRDGENGKKMEWNGMENNDEHSGPLTLLPVDRLTATDCNAAVRANFKSVNLYSLFPCTMFLSGSVLIFSIRFPAK